MHEITIGEEVGLETITLSSPSLSATFVPSAGMVATALMSKGENLLETRGGLEDYIERRSTMGIPFLHPWGNRIAGSYEAEGKRAEIDMTTQVPPLRADPNGLPIHGALAADDRWQVTTTEVEADHATLVATFHYDTEDLLEVFPYPHTVTQAVTLETNKLTIATTIEADQPTPIAFGFHPYFKFTDNPEIDFPVGRHIVTDSRSIPTGDTDDQPIEPGPLGERTWDDGFRLDGPTTFKVGGTQIEFERGYPVVIIWRPEGEHFICVEPMTAETNALVAGTYTHTAKPGEPFTASFSITVNA